eukprot:COSAG02_NODE_8410_length_2582_cov_3.531212_2_plen_109_part_00
MLAAQEGRAGEEGARCAATPCPLRPLSPQAMRWREQALGLALRWVRVRWEEGGGGVFLGGEGWWRLRGEIGQRSRAAMACGDPSALPVLSQAVVSAAKPRLERAWGGR